MNNYFKITIPMAIFITLSAVIYQRSTGPTYPKKFKIGPEDKQVRVKLPRSQGGTVDALVELPKLSETMEGTLTYKRFPTADEYTTVALTSENGKLIGRLPNQPPAGKLQYFVKIKDSWGEQSLGDEKEPILIRYKGEVPTWVLAPHVFFMFLAMLLSSLAGFEAIKKSKSYKKVAFMACGSLLFGGMVLGPIVQKYAFGVYWAGFPYDWDLTDNKLLVGVIFWVAACLLNFKKARPIAVMVAALALLGVYSIPHSMMGSQYNYETGQVETDK